MPDHKRGAVACCKSAWNPETREREHAESCPVGQAERAMLGGADAVTLKADDQQHRYERLAPQGWTAFGSAEGWQELTASELVLIHDDRGQRGTRWRIMRVVEEHPQRVEVAQLKEPGHLRHYTLADFVRSFGVVLQPNTLPNTLLARYPWRGVAMPGPADEMRKDVLAYLEQLGSGGALLPAGAELETIPPRDVFDMLVADANCAECEADLHRGDIVWLRKCRKEDEKGGLTVGEMVCVPCARGPLLEAHDQHQQSWRALDSEQRIPGEYREVALAEGEMTAEAADVLIDSSPRPDADAATPAGRLVSLSLSRDPCSNVTECRFTFASYGDRVYATETMVAFKICSGQKAVEGRGYVTGVTKGSAGEPDSIDVTGEVRP